MVLFRARFRIIEKYKSTSISPIQSNVSIHIYNVDFLQYDITPQTNHMFTLPTKAEGFVPVFLQQIVYNWNGST